MSSSDSDVDCYGGAAGRLDALKSQFVSHTPAKDDTPEVIQTFQKDADKENSTWEEIQESFQLPEDILSKGLPKKRGRGKNKSPAAEGSSNVEVKRKGRTSKNSQKAECTANKSASPEKKSKKAKCKRKSPRRQNILNFPQHPTYLIGEGEGYIDHSEGVKLFQKSSSTNNKSVQCVDRVILDSDSDSRNELDESLVNPIMSVKVNWRSKDIEKFLIRKFQKVTPIFEHFSKLEDVMWENLYFEYNGQLLKPSDTPDSIAYNIAKFIEGGVVRHNVFEITKYKDTAKEKIDSSKLSIKFQIANRKNPILVKLGPQEKFLLALVKLSEELGISTSKLKCTFDGDLLDPQSSPEDLQFEEGECVDVACG